MTPTLCPYCHQPAQLVDGAAIYRCRRVVSACKREAVVA